MPTENYVYEKEVDWSLFNYGLSIPIQYQVKFNQIAGRFIERGESKAITLYLNGKSYKARLNNYKIDAKYGNHADMVQIRYSGNSEIANALRGCFRRSNSNGGAEDCGEFAFEIERCVFINNGYDGTGLEDYRN